MAMSDREAAFRLAARLVTELGSTPYCDWHFTLELADWLLADSASGPAPVPQAERPVVYEWLDAAGRCLLREMAVAPAGFPPLDRFADIGDDRAVTMVVRRGDVIEAVYARPGVEGTTDGVG